MPTLPPSKNQGSRAGTWDIYHIARIRAAAPARVLSRSRVCAFARLRARRKVRSQPVISPPRETSTGVNGGLTINRCLRPRTPHFGGVLSGSDASFARAGDRALRSLCRQAQRQSHN